MPERQRAADVRAGLADAVPTTPGVDSLAAGVDDAGPIAPVEAAQPQRKRRAVAPTFKRTYFMFV